MFLINIGLHARVGVRSDASRHRTRCASVALERELRRPLERWPALCRPLRDWDSGGLHGGRLHGIGGCASRGVLMWQAGDRSAGSPWPGSMMATLEPTRVGLHRRLDLYTHPVEEVLISMRCTSHPRA